MRLLALVGLAGRTDSRGGFFRRAFLRGAVFGRAFFRGAVSGRAVFRRTSLRRGFVSRPLRFGLLVLLRLCITAVGRWRMRLIGVVGYVPARPFELHGGGGDHLFNFATTLRTLLDHPVGEFLDFLKAVTALLALIFVKGHGF